MSDDARVRPANARRCAPVGPIRNDKRDESRGASADRYYSVETVDAVRMEPTRFAPASSDENDLDTIVPPLKQDQTKRPPIKIITANGYMLYSVEGVISRLLHKIFKISKAPIPKKRAAQLAKWLKFQGADVVAVQELFTKDLFEKIAKDSGYRYKVFFSERQLAIYSKYPIKSSKFHKFSWQTLSDSRCIASTFLGHRYGFGLAEIDYKGETIYVANFHGMSRLEKASKVGIFRDRLTPQRLSHFLEARLALEDVMHSGKPVFLTGDFNFNPTYKEHAFFKQLFGNTTTDALTFSISMGFYTGELSTFSATNPWAREQKLPSEGVLDYVFVSGAQVFDAWIDHPKPAFSDHWPVAACVGVKPSSVSPMWMADPKMNRLGIGPSQVESLIRYFKKAKVPSFCRVSGKPDLVNQRERILAVLRRVRERITQEEKSLSLSQLSNHIVWK